MIIQILEREKEGLEQFTSTDGYDYEGGSNVLKMLGYYSMIGLLRVHCLLGDYHTGLKCLSPIDISQQGVYTIVIGSHISAIYHYGFANLMLRRYVDLFGLIFFLWYECITNVILSNFVSIRSSCLEFNESLGSIIVIYNRFGLCNLKLIRWLMLPHPLTKTIFLTFLRF